MTIVANDIYFFSVYLIHYNKAVLEICIDILPDMKNKEISNKLLTKYIYKPVWYSST
jgi:hypothetical protein